MRLRSSGPLWTLEFFWSHRGTCQSGCSLEIGWVSLSLEFFDKTARVFLLKEGLLIKEKSYRGYDDSMIPFSWYPSNPNPYVSVCRDKDIPVWDMRTTNALTLNFKQSINICGSPIGETIDGHQGWCCNLYWCQDPPFQSRDSVWVWGQQYFLEQW